MGFGEAKDGSRTDHNLRRPNAEVSAKDLRVGLNIHKLNA
jgi:hypothetical protein